MRLADLFKCTQPQFSVTLLGKPGIIHAFISGAWWSTTKHEMRPHLSRQRVNATNMAPLHVHLTTSQRWHIKVGMVFAHWLNIAAKACILWIEVLWKPCRVRRMIQSAVCTVCTVIAGRSYFVEKPAARDKADTGSQQWQVCSTVRSIVANQ